MTKRMLIDATHPEETRVVVLAGNRLDEYDFETSTKKQLKGNIYLAKVTRVEPSLQAAFVEFGGNRHGFLAFSEIHPDYYQIPVADRAALLREYEEELAAEAAAEEAEDDEVAEASADADVEAPPEPPEEIVHEIEADSEPEGGIVGEPAAAEAESGAPAANFEPVPEVEAESASSVEALSPDDGAADDILHELPPPPPAEDIGGGGDADVHQDERRQNRPRRHRYKIQEVIKRRQILLVQVVKEERGTKGAALTTYLSLAGRYCVLMPNTAKGGGISRKITNAGDRKRMKSLIADLEIADGMAVILRTAAVERSKAELKRDFEFLMRAWDQVRELTLKSIAPTLVYEEANLIKRSIRDLYTKDIDEVLVDGDEGYKTAKEFMRMLMPSHAKKVQPYKDPEIPLFHRYQVEAQLDAMHSPQVQLKSGGYIVINPTEALVSIDVNSGRATRERNIEETAYKTNLEAADEIARQLRLRDLAGLIVIDFIDMAEHRNQHNVERRIKDAMRSDRARIQIGRISAFGLLELSRQRLRPSLIETSTQPCPHCHGTGLIRSTESAALHVLRAIEEEGIRRRSVELRISVPTVVALYVLNQKRAMLRAIESRYGFSVQVDADDTLIPPDYGLERVEGRPVGEAPRPEAVAAAPEIAEVEEDVIDEAEAENEIEAQDDSGAPPRQRDGKEERGGRRRGRRGRRGRRADGSGDAATSEQTPAGDLAAAPVDGGSDAASEGEAENHDDGSEAAGKAQGTPSKRRRRGRRGGRRRGRNRDGDTSQPAGSQAQGTPAGDTAIGDAPTNDDTHTRTGEKTSAPTPDDAVTSRPDEINGYTDTDAPVPAASRNGNADGDGQVPDSPAPPDVSVEPEVAAKTDAPKRKGWWNRFGG